MKLSLENEEIIDKIFAREERERTLLLERTKLYKVIELVCYIISIITIIISFLSIFNNWNIMNENSFMFLFFITCIPTGIAQLLNKSRKNSEKEFSKNIKKQVMPIILKEFPNIKKTLNAINFNDLFESGLLNFQAYLDEDDAFIFNYQNKDAFIAEAETYRYTSKHRQKTDIQRWLILGFYTSNIANNKTIITSKNFIEDLMENMVKIILYIVFFNFLLIFPSIYFKQIFENKELYLSSTAHYVFNIGIPAIIIIIGILVLLYSIPAIKRIIKKDYIFLRNVKLANDFNIKSSNEIDAKYIITPAFLEKLRKIKTIFKTNHIKCSLYKNRVLLVLKVKEDLFEVANLHEPLIIKNYFRKTITQINAVKKIILALDETRE